MTGLTGGRLTGAHLKASATSATLDAREPAGSFLLI